MRDLKTPGDILRQARADTKAYIDRLEASAAQHEREAKRERGIAQEEGYRHCRLGASIQVLEGDDAPIDFPDDLQPEQSH